MNLLGAVAAARNGLLAQQVRELGLDAIEGNFTKRWEDRIERDARSAGIAPAEVQRIIDEQPMVVLDAGTLDAIAGEAFDCAADVSGSHGA